MIVSFPAAISVSGSAIKIGGGAGDACIVQLECHVRDQVSQLAELRGQELRVVMGTVQDMARLAEFIDHDDRRD